MYPHSQGLAAIVSGHGHGQEGCTGLPLPVVGRPADIPCTLLQGCLDLGGSVCQGCVGTGENGGTDACGEEAACLTSCVAKEFITRLAKVVEASRDVWHRGSRLQVSTQFTTLKELGMSRRPLFPRQQHLPALP